MSKLQTNYELISDKTKNPVVNTEYIKHGDDWLDVALAEAAAEVAKKANKTDVNNELNKKASTEYVNAELSKKTDKTEVAAELVTKANKIDVETALSNKADSSALRNTNETLADLNTKQSALSARMDTFTRLEEGSTTGDAELADGRVGVDGKTYTNIGGAIRGQVTDLKEDLKYNCTNVFSEIFAEYREANPSYYNEDRARITQGVTFQWGTKWGQCNVTGTAGTGTAIANIYYNTAALPSCMKAGKTYPFNVKVVGENIFILIRFFDSNGRYFPDSIIINEDENINELTVPADAYGMVISVRVSPGMTASGAVGNFKILSTISNENLASAVDNCFSGVRSTVNDTSVYKSFNDFEDDRFFCLNTTGLTECPEDAKGILLTFGSVGGESTAKSGRRLQIFRSSETGITYIRNVMFVSSATWGEWSALNKNVNPSVSLFKRIGVIGDSFASGEVYSSGSSVDNYEMSWLQIMARQNGFAGTNYSKGGLTSGTWLTDSKGLSLLQSSVSDDLYLITLGINDANKMILGTVSDIGTDAETFYGCYSKIIKKIKEKNNKSKIICFTLARYGGNYDDFSNAIKTIAVNLDVPAIDVSKNSFFSSNWFKNNQQSNHPTVSNYAAMANAYKDMIEICMSENAEYFKDYSSNNYSVHSTAVVGFTKDIYVDAVNGSDGNEGTAEKPFATLGKALSLYNGYYDDGYYDQFVIYLSDGEYIFPYRSTWHGCPHIFAMSGKHPSVRFTVNDNAGPRFYSTHVYFKGVTFKSDFGGFYLEGTAVSAENCTFECALRVIGGSFDFHKCLFKANSCPYSTKTCVNINASNGRFYTCTFEHTSDMYAILAENGSNVVILGGITCTNGGATTKEAIRISYSSLKTNGNLNFEGYGTNKIGINASIFIAAGSAYDELVEKIGNTNSIISSTAIDLVKMNRLINGN